MKWRLSILYPGIVLMFFMGLSAFVGATHNEEPVIAHVENNCGCTARCTDLHGLRYPKEALPDMRHAEPVAVREVPHPPRITAKRFLVLCSILV